MNDILQISTTNRIADYTDVARRRKAAISEAHEELKERTKEVELNLIVKKIKTMVHTGYQDEDEEEEEVKY